MTLRVHQSCDIPAPSADQIASLLGQLVHGRDDSFIVLSRNRPYGFLQAWRVSKDRFDVEYREGNTRGRQFAARLTFSQTKRAFLYYVAGDSRYREMVKWKDISHEVNGPDGIKRFLRWLDSSEEATGEHDDDEDPPEWPGGATACGLTADEIFGPEEPKKRQRRTGKT